MLVKIGLLLKNPKLQYILADDEIPYEKRLFPEFRGLSFVLKRMTEDEEVDTKVGQWKLLFETLDRMNPRYIWVKMIGPGELTATWHRDFRLFVDDREADENEQRMLVERYTPDNEPVLAGSDYGE